MTDKPDLPPSSVTAFTEALKGARGSLDAWLEVNDEREVAAHIEAYARACATELQREIEALRAEVREAREFRDKMANAIENDQLRRFIEKHGEPVPLTIRMQEAESRAERLAEALRDAATSMQAIADKAGRDEYLMTIDEVRCYANSRASAARAALEQEE